MSNPEQFEFFVGNWRVEPAYGRISMEGCEEHLQARRMSVLLYLAQNCDRVVSTDEIMEKVWGDIHVTLDSLYLNISYLRKALAQDPENVEYIETVPKSGYRLIAPVVFPHIEKKAAKQKKKNRILSAAIFVLAVVAIIILPGNKDQDEQAVPVIPNSIAVLPFVSLESGNDTDLSVLFADALMNQLTTIEGMEVMARTSSFTMHERGGTAQEIGQRLGVSTVLEGSLRREEMIIHITAQLIDTSDGMHMWSNTFARDIDAFWDVHDEIAQQVAQVMGMDMPPAYLATLEPMDRPIVRRTRVNSYISDNQQGQRVIGLHDGGHLIGWQSREQDGSAFGIYAQQFDKDGQPDGEELRLHISDLENQTDLYLAPQKNGGFMATWHSWLFDGSSWGIVGRYFDQQGDPTSDEFGVNMFSRGEQGGARIAMNTDDHSLVVFYSRGQDESYEILARLFDGSGKALGDEYLVNEFTQGKQFMPGLAKLKAGGFVVTWSSSGKDGSGLGIAGRLLTETGQPNGPEFDINSFTNGDQDYSAVSALEDGGFVVAWETQDLDHDGQGGWGIFAQRFDAGGNRVNGEFGLNAFAHTDQRRVHLTSMPEGGFFAAWESQDQAGSGMDIFGRRFDSAGKPMGTEILINVVTNSYQRRPMLATMTDGSVMTAFYSDDWDGSYYGVFSRRLVFNKGTVMYGRAGADTFVFDEVFGQAEIQGFDTEIDRIALSGMSTGLESLLIEPVAGGMLVTVGKSQIRIPGIDMLEAGHFLF